MSKETLGLVLGIAVGVVGLALYLIDKAGINTPVISLALLIFISALCLCGILLIPWIWSGPRAEVMWKAASVSLVTILVVWRFGIWVWQRTPIRSDSKTNISLADKSSKQAEGNSDTSEVSKPQPTVQHSPETHPAPQKAKVNNEAEFQFSFYELDREINLPPILEMTLPLVSNAVTVDFMVTNISKSTAVNPSIYIRVCDQCKYAAEPEGFVFVPGAKPQERERKFDRTWALSRLPKMSVSVIPPAGAMSFLIGFYFACDNCPAPDGYKPQLLTVQIQPAPNP